MLGDLEGTSIWEGKSFRSGGNPQEYTITLGTSISSRLYSIPHSLSFETVISYAELNPGDPVILELQSLP